jgi:hypothetical protein
MGTFSVIYRHVLPCALVGAGFVETMQTLNSAEWEHLLLVGVLVGDIHCILEVSIHFWVHNVPGGEECQLEVEVTVNC